MGADFDTNSLHVVLTLYGATGYVMRAPPWKPACVQDDVTFLGMWGGELMSARALHSRPEAGSSEWCSRVVAKTVTPWNTRTLPHRLRRSVAQPCYLTGREAARTHRLGRKTPDWHLPVPLWTGWPATTTPGIATRRFPPTVNLCCVPRARLWALASFLLLGRR